MEYFGLEKGVACVGCSIANALLDSDPETARMAYRRIRDFPIQRETGEIMSLYAVDALKHATAERYDGKLALILTDGTATTELIKILQRKIQEKTIIPLPPRRRIQIVPPAVLFLKGWREGKMRYHTVAVTENKGNFTLINNGTPMTLQELTYLGWTTPVGTLNMFRIY